MKAINNTRQLWICTWLVLSTILSINNSTFAQTPFGVSTTYQTNQVYSLGNGHYLPRVLVTHNLNAAKTCGIDKTWKHPGIQIPLRGTGVKVAVWDAGETDSTHPEFENRISQKDAGAEEIHWHATHVTGTIAAKGIDPEAIGMANKLNVSTFDWHNDILEMREEANKGLLLSNHSYGLNAGWSLNQQTGIWYWYGYDPLSEDEDFFFGFYSQDSRDFDLVANDYPDYLIVCAAGNDRSQLGPAEGQTYLAFNYTTREWEPSNLPRNPDGGADGFDCMSHGAVAKNVLSVGASRDLLNYTAADDVEMTRFSSWGPTDDGRIKPDISANGHDVYSTIPNTNNRFYGIASGTSMATPSVTGGLALVQEYNHSQTEAYLKAATLKGLAIHTAAEAGPAEGPDYMFGWGLLNTKAAIDVLASNFDEEDVYAQLEETTLMEGESISYSIYSDGTSPLATTISWNDPASTVRIAQLNSRTPMLVNDLDIRIERVSDGELFYPYKLNPANPSNAATKGNNLVDNVEKVFIATPEAGEYKVHIFHKGDLQGGEQDVSFIMSGLSSSPEEQEEDCDLVAAFSQSTPTCLGERSTFLNETMAFELFNNWLVNGESVSGQTNLNYVFEKPGSYEVSLVVFNDKCSDTTSQIFEVHHLDAAFTANANSPMNLALQPDSVNVDATYVWDLGDGTIIERNVIFHTYKEAGTYKVCLTASIDGCVAESCQEVVISEQPCPKITDILVSHTSCGLANGSLAIEVENTDPPQLVSYLWSNGATTQSIENVEGGKYSVTITSEKGCSSERTATINSSDAVSVSLDNAYIDCNTIKIFSSISNAVEPISYQWDDRSTESSLTITQGGAYSLTITDANNCTASTSITIKDMMPLEVNLSTTNTSCGLENGMASIDISKPDEVTTIEWSNGTIGVNEVQDLTAAAYSVSVTDKNGCTVTKEFTIEASTALNATITKEDTRCGETNGSVSIQYDGPNNIESIAWNNGEKTRSISNLAAGTYTATITDDTGCTQTLSATIEESITPDVSIAVTPADCGIANGSATITPLEGVEIKSYEWNTGQKAASLSELSAGMYQVVITDINDCQIEKTVIVPGGADIDISVEVKNASCGKMNGEATAIIPDGLKDVSFVWNTGATTQKITGLDAGTYTVTVKTGEGCASSASNDITTPLAPQFEVITTSTTCGKGNGKAAINLAKVPNTNPSYFWTTGATTPSISTLDAGIYKVTVYYEECFTTKEFEIEGSEDVSVELITTDESCGAKNGTVKINQLSGGEIASYLWSNGATTKELTDISEGLYRVTVTDIYGCQSSAGSLVNSIDGPSVSISTKEASCGIENGTAEVIIDGEQEIASYLWNTGETTAKITDKAAGIYEVIVTDVNGCQTVEKVEITASGSLQMVATKNNTTCGLNNGSINLSQETDTEIVSYLWNDGETTMERTNLTAGNYAVTVTDMDGCTFTDTFTIDASEALRVDISKEDATCAGHDGTAIANRLTGGNEIQYIWSNGETTQSIVDLAAGTYTVTVTDEFGCFSIQETTIEQPEVAAFTYSSKNATCGNNNGSATIEVPNDGDTYYFDWSNGAIDQEVDMLEAGIYSVTVTNSKGCTQTIEVIISSEEGPSIELQRTNADCDDSNGTISVDVTSGHSNLTYLWSNGETTPTISELAPGRYSVTVSDANGCQTIDQIRVNGKSSPTFEITQMDTKCNFQNGYASVSRERGDNNWTYLWSNGETSKEIANLSPGQYTVTVTSEGGCSSTKEVNILPSEELKINLVTTEGGCDGMSAALEVIGLSNNELASYTWSNGDNSQRISGLSADTYCVTVTDISGCVANACKTIEQTNSNFKITASSTPAGCKGGGTASVTVEEDVEISSIVWSNGQTTPTIEDLEPGIYRVTITNSDGCMQTADVLVIATETLEVDATLELQNTTCGEENGAVFLRINSTPDDIVSYLWSNGSTSRNLVDVPAGDYSLVMTDRNGCEHTLSTTINASLQAKILALVGNSSCGYDNGQVLLRFTNTVKIESITWEDGSTGEYRGMLPEGTYTATIIDEYGCEYTEVVKVESDRPALNTVVSVTPSVCGQNNGTATISADIMLQQIDWSNGKTGSTTLENLAAGKYHVLVGSANGCGETVEFEIPETPIELDVSAVITPSPTGQSEGKIALIINTNARLYYQWSTGERRSYIENKPKGEYSVTITTDQGCTQIETFSITRTKKGGGRGNPPDDILVPTSVDAPDGNNPNSTDEPIIDNEDEINEPLAPLTDHILDDGISSVVNEEDLTTVTNYIDDYYTPDGGISSSDLRNNEDEEQFENEEEEISVICPAGNAFELEVNTRATICGLDNGVATADVLYHNQIIISYEWSNGMEGRTITNVPAGEYTLKVTDINGCTAITSVQIEANEAPEVDLGYEEIELSSNESILLDAYGSSEWEYHWSNGAETATIVAEEAGTYTVTVITPEGCRATDEVSIKKTMPWEENNDLFQVYPIPATESITVTTAATNGYINIYTLDGRIVANYTLQTGKQVLPIHTLSPGIYILEQATPQGDAKRQKIVVE